MKSLATITILSLNINILIITLKKDILTFMILFVQNYNFFS